MIVVMPNKCCDNPYSIKRTYVKPKKPRCMRIKRTCDKKGECNNKVHTFLI